MQMVNECLSRTIRNSKSRLISPSILIRYDTACKSHWSKPDHFLEGETKKFQLVLAHSQLLLLCHEPLIRLYNPEYHNFHSHCNLVPLRMHNLM